jgi:putative flippase GtrA
VDFSIYAALVLMGISVYWANLAGFCVGVPLNVVLIRAFVFPDSRFELSEDVLLSIAANGAMLALGTGLLWVLVDWALLNPYVAKLLTNFTTFMLNYMTRAVFFRAKKE